MISRTSTRTITDLRQLLERLEQDRYAYDLVSFAQLKLILRRRIGVLAAELRARQRVESARHAA